MNKILNVKSAEKVIHKLKRQKQLVVICGGCFDILHVGHIKFLQKAKEKGDFLFVLLENDESVKKLKGIDRPINSQGDRAEILSSVKYVDYVVKLNNMTTNKDYDNLLITLKPDVIATTKNEPQAIHNKRQAKLIGAKVLYVINRISDKSTSTLSKKISKYF